MDELSKGGSLPFQIQKEKWKLIIDMSKDRGFKLSFRAFKVEFTLIFPNNRVRFFVFDKTYRGWAIRGKFGIQF